MIQIGGQSVDAKERNKTKNNMLTSKGDGALKRVTTPLKGEHHTTVSNRWDAVKWNWKLIRDRVGCGGF